MVKVEKKEGNVEEFEKKKLVLSLLRAGSPPDQAERILANIEAWLNSQEQKNIKSSEIKIRVGNILKRINPQAARGYKIYRKSH